MVMSQDQNAGQSHNMKIDNRTFEKEEELKNFGATLNQNSVQEEIKSKLSQGMSAESFVFQFAIQKFKD
jgi:hypothetical protein